MKERKQNTQTDRQTDKDLVCNDVMQILNKRKAQTERSI